MKWLISTLALALIAVCGLFASTTAPSTKEGKEALKTELLRLETLSWEAFKNHDKKLYASICSPQFFEIDNEGTLLTLADVLKSMDEYETPSYKIEDVEVFKVNELTAMIRYKITATYVVKGKALPTTSGKALTVYIKEGEKWLAASYQETLIKPATTP